MAPSADIQSTYTQGHHVTVLKSHASRTAAKNAAYLIPHIKTHFRILDVGCGPGSITVDLARLVPQGSIIGLDYSSVAVNAAKKLASDQGIKNAEFKTGDAYHLYWEDETFDVVHCHQCLIHMDDPGRVLKEMRRVCKKGGIVAAREADMGTLAIYPPTQRLEYLWDITRHSIRSGGGEPDAGRFLVAWAREAGFARSEVAVTGTVDIASTAEERRIIGTTHPDRLLSSEMGTKAIEAGILGLTTRQNLEDIAAAWKEWISDDDGFFALTQTEVLCRKDTS